MDKDGDGFITKSEFKKICRNLTAEQIEATFAKFDKAGNGKLNYRCSIYALLCVISK